MSQKDPEKYHFLVKLALESGAADAKIIPANQVIVEDRVVLKCKSCKHYGETLACPPYTPSAEQFRKIVLEYSYAMFMKFSTTASVDSEVYPHLMTYLTNDSLSKEIKDKAAKFWQDWKESKYKILQSIVGLEKAAMKQGYSLAMAFVSGHCQLCDKCNTDTKICRHPEIMRMSEDAIGVNVKKTAANAGIAFQFPFTSSAESFGLLLIE